MWWQMAPSSCGPGQPPWWLALQRDVSEMGTLADGGFNQVPVKRICPSSACILFWGHLPCFCGDYRRAYKDVAGGILYFLDPAGDFLVGLSCPSDLFEIEHPAQWCRFEQKDKISTLWASFLCRFQLVRVKIFEPACLSQGILRSQQCSLGFELEETMSWILDRLLALARLLGLWFTERRMGLWGALVLYEDMKNFFF